MIRGELRLSPWTDLDLFTVYEQEKQMKQSIFTVVRNEALTDCVYKMVLAGDCSAITAPGQFVNIQLSGLYLRRPISVCDWDAESLTIIYKVVGKGTEQMSKMAPGETLDVLTGLGNGYDMTLSGDAPVLLGGGVGVPPMYGLSKRLRAEGKKVSVILGFNTASEKFYEKEPFVRVLEKGKVPNITSVTYSNYCDIGLAKDAHTGKLIIMSVIDNMGKGAAGQAIQNMNIKCGLEETTGLLLTPPAI